MKWRIFDENLFPHLRWLNFKLFGVFVSGIYPYKCRKNKKLLSLATYEESTSDLFPKDLSPFVSLPLICIIFD